MPHNSSWEELISARFDSQGCCEDCGLWVEPLKWVGLWIGQVYRDEKGWHFWSVDKKAQVQSILE